MKVIDLNRHRYFSHSRDMEFYCDVVCSGKYYFLSINVGGLNGEPFSLLGIKENDKERFDFEGCIGYSVDRNNNTYPIFDSREDVIKMIDYLNDRFNHLNDINLESIVLEFD